MRPGIVALAFTVIIASHAMATSLQFNEARTSPEPVGDGPNAITAGDFDGDGDVDLAVANYNSNNVTILLNNGSGNFRNFRTVLAGFRPFAIVSADLDGDGDIDLAVANVSSGDVTILKNVRGGNFREPDTSPVDIGFASNPRAIVAADFDRDGDIDLAVVSESNDNITILRNGARRFVALTPIQVGDWPVAIAAGDFDGDGDVDLAVANWVSDNVTIFRNDLGLSFTQPPSSPVPAGNAPYAIVAADLDRDGDIDLAVANQLAAGTVTILRNQGGLNFAAAGTIGVGTSPVSIAAADFDGDGDNDLAVANFGSDNVTILRNKGALVFAPLAAGPELAGDGPISIARADLDGDGDIDLAVANSNSDNVTILKNR
jgi:hypothetical protein